MGVFTFSELYKWYQITQSITYSVLSAKEFSACIYNPELFPEKLNC